MRVIDWPAHHVRGRPRSGRDVVRRRHGPGAVVALADGRASTIVDAARRLGVRRRGHARRACPRSCRTAGRVPVLATATHRSLAQELAPLRPDYAGPTGLQTIVQRALGDADIPCVGLWAQVPQYVSGSPSPPAVRALLRAARRGRPPRPRSAVARRAVRRVPARASKPGWRPGPTCRSRRPHRSRAGRVDRRPRRRDRALPAFPIRAS